MGSIYAQRSRAIRECVANRIGANRFRTWFGENVEFQLRGEARLDVMVDNAFVGGWIASNFMDELLAASQEVLGQRANVDVRVRDAAAPSGNGHPPTAPAERPAQRGRRRAARSARLRGHLDAFVVGGGNQLAYAAARQVVEAPGDQFKLMVVHGACGLGKTHLLQGICNGVDARHPALQWCYISGEEFTNEFIATVRNGRADLFRARFRNVDVLVIDDIHFLKGKKATQDEFLHTFDAIDATGKAVVLSSDRHPRSIATLSEPLINRLISGMVVEITPPDYETRCRILQRRAEALKRPLPQAVTELVAAHISRNVRELEGALHRLVATASLTQEPITLEMARVVLADCLAAARPPVTLAQIESRTAEYFGVSPERIRSRSRDRTVSLARAVAMFLVRRHTSLSFPEIGREMGKKNHSTVLMAAQRIDNQVRDDQLVSWKCLTGPKSLPIRKIIATIESELNLAPLAGQPA